LRKLERVDQNVQRLRDIIDEVEKQLRSVKLQAAKAQRYQEYSTRLKELRVAQGLDEYHQLAEKLREEMTVLEELKAGLEERSAQVEAWEANSRRLEETLGRLDEGVREQEAALANARQQIAAEETTLGHEWSLSANLETDLRTTRARMNELNVRVAALAQEAGRAAEELGAGETQGNDQRQQVRTLEDELGATVLRLAELQNQLQTDQAEHLEQMRQAARLHNDTVDCQARIETLRAERQRLLPKPEQAAEHLASLDGELQEWAGADAALQDQLAEARRHLSAQRQERDRLHQLSDDTHQQVAD